MQTGDLLLFKGHAWSSRVVQCLTHSSWSHCGLVWRDPPDLAPGPYILQSDVNSIELGVSCIPLQVYVDNYPGTSYYLPLEISNERREGLQSQLPALFTATDPIQYNIYPLDLWRAVTRSKLLSFRAYKREYFICSAYVMYLYAQTGIASGDWTLVQPRDFADKESEYVVWEGCSVGEPIKLIKTNEL